MSLGPGTFPSCGKPTSAAVQPTSAVQDRLWKSALSAVAEIALQVWYRSAINVKGGLGYTRDRLVFPEYVSITS